MGIFCTVVITRQSTILSIPIDNSVDRRTVRNCLRHREDQLDYKWIQNLRSRLSKAQPDEKAKHIH